MSLLQNCTLILLFWKYNMNLKYRASTTIAWGCMKLKLRLSCNPELLWYKVIKTCRRIQQRYSSWNLFLYIFTLIVSNIYILSSKKKTKKQKKDSQTAYVLTLHYTPPAVRTCTLLNWPLVWVACCGSLWFVVACCGWLWLVVTHCGSLWFVVAHCGSLWLVVIRCGSLHSLV